jgi:hypothetical protein
MQNGVVSKGKNVSGVICKSFVFHCIDFFNALYVVFLVMFSSPVFFTFMLLLSRNQFTRHVLLLLVSLLKCPTSYMAFPAFLSLPVITYKDCIWDLFYSDGYVSYRVTCCMVGCQIHNRYRGFNIYKTLVYLIEA